MTDRPQDDARSEPAQKFDDPTRDIRLPPMPGRPAPEVRSEWAGLMRTPEPGSAPAEERIGREPIVEASDSAAEAPARPRIADQPTDELGNPSAAVRQRTMAFAPPTPAGGDTTAEGSAPPQGPPGYLPAGYPQPGAAPQQAARPAPPRRRRSTWPWVLAVLVLLALFAAAVTLDWVGGDKDNLHSFWESAAPLGYRVG